MITQTQQCSTHTSKLWLAGFAALVGLFFAVSVVSAAFISINTNDGVVDPNWAANPYTQLVVNHPRNTGIDAHDDIKNAWFANDGEFIVWRIQTYSSPLATDGKVAVGVLDCNLDNDLDDSVDRKIVFNPNSDTYEIYRGNGAKLNNIDLTRSERIGDSVEFKVIWANMDPWCVQTNSQRTRLGFAIAQSGSGAVQDPTNSYDWYVPTSVTLREFSSDSGLTRQRDLQMILGGGGLAVLAVLGFISFQRQRRIQE